MLKYGMYAKAVELLCFKQALARLAQIYPDMDIKKYKRSVKREPNVHNVNLWIYEESFDQRFLDLIAAFDKCGKYLYEGSLKW